MDHVNLERVQESDLEELQRIGRRTFKETFEAEDLESDMEKYLNEKFNESQLKLELRNQDSIFYFARLNKEVIGYLKVNLGQAQTEHLLKESMEIERIYVDSNYYGKGVGKVLFDKAIELAEEKKTQRVWLGVWEENPRAIRFYSKHGFHEFDKHIFKLGDDEQTDLLMKMEL